MRSLELCYNPIILYIVVSVSPSYLEEETEPDPLVVLDVLLVPLVPGLVDPGVGDVHPHPLPVRGTERVGGVDPAVGVQHVLRDLFGVNTHDR